MTETMAERTEAGERPRCLEGSKTDRPCWREAVERRYASDKEPTVCAEHLREYKLILKRDELLKALQTMGEWITSWDDARDGGTPLQEFAFAMRGKALEELWSAAVEAEAAALIAMQGPEETPLTVEQAERLEALRLRSDALTDAHVLLEDLREVPEGAFGTRSRWEMAAAVKAASNEASVEHTPYALELGRS